MQSLPTSEDILFEDNEIVLEVDEQVNDEELCADSKSIMCHFCSNVIPSKERFSHQFNINVIYKCKLCEKSFSTEGQLQNHSLSHKDISYRELLSPKELFVCRMCYEEFCSKMPSISFVQTDATAKPCTITAYHSMVSCEGISSVTSLDIDLHSQTDKKQHTCEVCNKSFCDKADLKQHFNAVCAKKKTFICKICKKEFPQKRYLKLHYHMHKDKKLYVCELCGKTFQRKGRFDTHCYSHIKRKPSAGNKYDLIMDLLSHRNTID